MTPEDFKAIQDAVQLGIAPLYERVDGVKTRMDAEFNHIHDRFDTIDKKTESIEKQTKLTNGRVNELEKKDLTHVIDCPRIDELDEIRKTISDKKGDSDKKIKEINDDLFEYKALKKWPKIALGIVVISCIIMFIAAYTAWTNFTKSATTTLKTELYNDIKSDLDKKVNN